MLDFCANKVAFLVAIMAFLARLRTTAGDKESGLFPNCIDSATLMELLWCTVSSLDMIEVVFSLFIVGCGLIWKKWMQKSKKNYKPALYTVIGIDISTEEKKKRIVCVPESWTRNKLALKIFQILAKFILFIFFTRRFAIPNFLFIQSCLQLNDIICEVNLSLIM